MDSVLCVKLRVRIPYLLWPPEHPCMQMPSLLTCSLVAFTPLVPFSSVRDPCPSYFREGRINFRTVCHAVSGWERLDWAQVKVTLRSAVLDLCAFFRTVIVNISALSLEGSSKYQVHEEIQWESRAFSLKGFAGPVLLKTALLPGEKWPLQLCTKVVLPWMEKCLKLPAVPPYEGFSTCSVLLIILSLCAFKRHSEMAPGMKCVTESHQWYWKELLQCTVQEKNSGFWN